MAIKISGSTIIDDSRNIVNAGIITATSFVGNGSGLTGAGSTVADDTSTNSTFFPLFTTTTSGTVTASKVSTTKLTFNPSTGALTATSLVGPLTGNSSTATTLQTARTINGVSFNGSANITVTSATLTTARTINGVSFNGSANIDVNPTTGAFSNGQGARTIQSGGTASGGAAGDIFYIF